MIKINLYCVGDLKKEYKILSEEFEKRISRFAKLEIIELKEKNNLDNVNLIIDSESQEIIEKINLNNAVLFDLDGKQVDSVEFSKFMENWFLTNSELSFVIGGSYGVNQKVKNLVKHKFSFGKCTFNHRLFRIMALEQIYRALTIQFNVCYHK